jgi:hypothetical protein
MLLFSCSRDFTSPNGSDISEMLAGLRCSIYFYVYSFHLCFFCYCVGLMLWQITVTAFLEKETACLLVNSHVKRGACSWVFSFWRVGYRSFRSAALQHRADTSASVPNVSSPTVPSAPYEF